MPSRFATEGNESERLAIQPAAPEVILSGKRNLLFSVAKHHEHSTGLIGGVHNSPVGFNRVIRGQINQKSCKVTTTGKDSFFASMIVLIESK